MFFRLSYLNSKETRVIRKSNNARIMHKRMGSYDLNSRPDYSLSNSSSNSVILDGSDQIVETKPEENHDEHFIHARDMVERERGRVRELLHKIEDLHKDLHLASVFKTNYNSALFTKKMTEVIECMGECEFLTDKQSQMSSQVLTLIAQSEANWILTQQYTVDIFAKMLFSKNVRHSMKCHIVIRNSLLPYYNILD